MALQLHPDKDPSAASAQEFARACEAYDVLSSGESHAYTPINTPDALHSSKPCCRALPCESAVAARHAAQPDAPCKQRHASKQASKQSTGTLLSSCNTPPRQTTHVSVPALHAAMYKGVYDLHGEEQLKKGSPGQSRRQQQGGSSSSMLHSSIKHSSMQHAACSN